MSDQSNQNGNLILPEFANPQQVFNSLNDRVKNKPGLHSATCAGRDSMAYLIVAGDIHKIGRLSRLLATLAASPLVEMPGKK